MTKLKLLAGDGVCCLLIIAIGLAIGLPRYLVNIDFADEGLLAYGAVRVMEGQIPYRDFVSLQAPLSFYTAAAMFKLFGTSLASLRVLGLSIHILIPVLIYAIGRQMAGRVICLAAAIPATVAGMPYFNFVPFAAWHGVLATLIVVLLLLRASATGRDWWAFSAGVITALAIISRHDQGFYLSVAVLVYGLALKFAKSETIENQRPGQMLGLWAAGTAVIILPLGIYWLACGAIPYMFRQLVVFPLTRYAKTSSLPMPRFDFNLPLRQNAATGLFYLPVILEGLAAIWVLRCLFRRRFYVEHSRVVFVLALSILFYCQVLARSDMHHLLVTLGPNLVLLAWCLWGMSKKLSDAIAKPAWDNKSLIPLFVTVVVGIAAVSAEGWFMWCTRTTFLKLPEEPTRAVSVERAGVRLDEQYAKFLENSVSLIRTHSSLNRSIICLPYIPMYYFLAERRNPTRWNYIWPGDQTPEDYQSMVNQARRDPPAVVIVARNLDIRTFAPIIINYLNTEYTLTSNLGLLSFYIPLDKQSNGTSPTSKQSGRPDGKQMGTY